jgi:NADPH:quinone reductase-like Zn-dependent oxidoreductase
VKEGQTILIHAAGTMIGFAAAQMALMSGARVMESWREAMSASLGGDARGNLVLRLD